MHLRGTCRALFCFHAGFEVDLAAARRALGAAEGTLFTRKHSPGAAVGPEALVLRLERRHPSLAVAGFSTAEAAELALYEMGVAAVAFVLPVEGDLEALRELSVALYDRAELREAARELAGGLFGDAGVSPRPDALSKVEDYVLFELEPAAGGVALELSRLTAEHGRSLAAILRAEGEELSAGQVADALSHGTGYTSNDLVLVDWLAAILIGESLADERRVLELANAELLALRTLDRELERAIEGAYAALAPLRPGRPLLASRSRDLTRIASLQADFALLREGADNPLKLLGDDYLARLYALTADRFHFGDWNAIITRRLGALEGIYSKLANQANQRRAEVLEWIIIVLIAVEIVLALVG